MERKEAIEVIKKNWPDSSFTMLRDALETLIPELKESEDDRIRKDIISYLKSSTAISPKTWIAWLERQGEHQKFRDSIQIGDNVTRNEDGMIVNLSQLNRVAKKEEPHGSQLTVEMEDVLNECIDMQNNSKDPCEGCDYKVKNCHNFPCDRKKTFDEQKFKDGDWVILTAGELSATLQIVNVDTYKRLYWFNDNDYLPIVDEECLRHWTIRDAKDGDVLATDDWVFIFKKLNTDGKPVCYCHYDIELGFHIDVNTYISTGSYIRPATREQRDTLLKAMSDAGYTFDFVKKELIIEESYQQQADDLIDMVTEKSAWSEEDEERIKNILSVLDAQMCWNGATGKKENPYQKEIDWLKSLKDRYTWKPSDEQIIELRRVISGCSYDIDPLVELETKLKEL